MNEIGEKEMLDMSCLNQLCRETGFQLKQWPSRSLVQSCYGFAEQRCQGSNKRFEKEVAGSLIGFNEGLVLKNPYYFLPTIFPQANEKELRQMKTLFKEMCFFTYHSDKDELFYTQRFLPGENINRLVTDCNEAILLLLAEYSPHLQLNYLFMDLNSKTGIVRKVVKEAIEQIAEHTQLKEKAIEYAYKFVLANIS